MLAEHIRASSMPRAVAVLAPYPNVYFETSVVPAYDLFTVLDATDPARVLYGSDLPYGSSANALHELAGCHCVVCPRREAMGFPQSPSGQESPGSAVPVMAPA
jgi:hypothetical protein